MAKIYEASFSDHGFTIAGIREDQLPAAIFTLANLAQQWASELIYDHEQAKEAELKVRVFDNLKRIFTSLDKDVEMIGESNKHYHFDYQAKLSSGKFMLIDTINNHPNAIASAFMRNADVRKAGNDNYIQEGIIEHQMFWKSEDLNLLNEVLDGVVPIESNLDALKKYA